MKNLFDELTEKMIEIRQRSASLEQNARQPYLATETDVLKDTKTQAYGGRGSKMSDKWG